MSRVLVTGAQGFIGQVLVRRLLQQGLAGRAVEGLTLMDLHFDAAPTDAPDLRDPPAPPDPRVHKVAGSIADAAVLAAGCEGRLDAVFHLASLPGGAAERDYALGRRVNLDATLALLEALRAQPAPPRLVYASSVAVYGADLLEPVDECTPAAPALSYGAHKLVCETLVADASRRGWVQGCSLRLPGVVARPGDGAGLMSAFMSQIFWKLAAGEPVTVPVSLAGQAWWISAPTCVDNLLLAAAIDPAALGSHRTHLMPVLHLSVGEVVAALARRFGADRTALVHCHPDPAVERLFARYPPLHTPRARALGFRDDGTVDQLVTLALGGDR